MSVTQFPSLKLLEHLWFSVNSVRILTEAKYHIKGFKHLVYYQVQILAFKPSIFQTASQTCLRSLDIVMLGFSYYSVTGWLPRLTLHLGMSV